MEEFWTGLIVGTGLTVLVFFLVFGLEDSALNEQSAGIGRRWDCKKALVRLDGESNRHVYEGKACVPVEKK